MANEQNLRPSEYKFTLEEAKKGGRKSGEARRRRKTLREIANMLGQLNAPEAVIKNLERNGMIGEGTPVTYDEAMVLAQYMKTFTGNTTASNFIAEIKGERIQRVEQVDIDSSAEALNEYFQRASDQPSED